MTLLLWKYCTISLSEHNHDIHHVGTLSRLDSASRLYSTSIKRQKDYNNKRRMDMSSVACFVFCLFLLPYVPCQQLWSLRDGQFT